MICFWYFTTFVATKLLEKNGIAQFYYICRNNITCKNENYTKDVTESIQFWYANRLDNVLIIMFIYCKIKESVSNYFDFYSRCVYENYDMNFLPL